MIDSHVHIVGNGSSGSGCRIQHSGAHKLLAHYMLHQLGLPQSSLRGDLDNIFVNRLVHFVESSELEQVVILAHEKVYDESGRVIDEEKSLYVPNDYIFRLAEKHNCFLPAVSIHPARADAIDELERCAEKGAVLMKCLPNCQNINCSDPRYKPFWSKMAELKLPLLAHTGGEHTVKQYNAKYADPRTLRSPLECGVTVIAAHCGTKSGVVDPEYFDVFCDLLQEHPNLYGDISGLQLPVRSAYLPRCTEGLVAERILHGSDFPVPSQPIWSWLRGHISAKTFAEARSIKNPLQRDVFVKRAIGIPDDAFTRAKQILRIAEL